MPTIELARSPLAPGLSPAPIAYREQGAGAPVLILHGGWGAAFYPFPELPGHRLVIPDRTGYGGSSRVADFARPFHAAAAAEHAAFLDALGLERCALWGHSDGAVIAAHMVLASPARYTALIVEAIHVDREKRASRAFFTMMAEDPDGFGERVAGKLAADHGDTWRDVIRADGRVWLDLAAQGPGDVYAGRLAELAAVPVLAIHGVDDPRSEPDELDRLRAAVPGAAIHVLAGAAHSPHSERGSREACAAIVAAFLADVSGRDR